MEILNPLLIKMVLVEVVIIHEGVVGKFTKLEHCDCEYEGSGIVMLVGYTI